MTNYAFYLFVYLFVLLFGLFGLLIVDWNPDFFSDIIRSAFIKSKLRNYDFEKLVNQMRKGRSRTCDILCVCVTEIENGKFTQPIDDFIDYLYPLNKKENIIDAELLDDHPKVVLALNYFRLKEELSEYEFSKPCKFSLYLQTRAAQIEKHLPIDYKSIKKAIKKQMKNEEEA